MVYLKDKGLDLHEDFQKYELLLWAVATEIDIGLSSK
jgi:hypothetical protein